MVQYNSLSYVVKRSIKRLSFYKGSDFVYISLGKIDQITVKSHISFVFIISSTNIPLKIDMFNENLNIFKFCDDW